MKRKGFTSTGTAASGAFASIGFVRAPARPAQYEFKAATSLPADHPLNVVQQQMWDAVERETGGRVHVTLYPNSQLGGDPAMLTQLRVGALMFHMNNPGVLASVAPVADTTNLGFAFNDEAQGFRVSDGPLGAYIAEESSAKGIHLFRNMWNSGMNQIGSSSHPIRTPEDLAGFKVGVVQSRVYVDLFKALGASAVPITGGEVYTALQTKIVDGEGGPLTTIETLKWYEMNKFINLIGYAWSGNWMMANADIWKTLPADIQQALERNNAKYAGLERKDSVAQNLAVIDEKRNSRLEASRSCAASTPLPSAARALLFGLVSRFGRQGLGPARGRSRPQTRVANERNRSARDPAFPRRQNVLPRRRLQRSLGLRGAAASSARDRRER